MALRSIWATNLSTAL